MNIYAIKDSKTALDLFWKKLEAPSYLPLGGFNNPLEHIMLDHLPKLNMNSSNMIRHVVIVLCIEHLNILHLIYTSRLNHFAYFMFTGNADRHLETLNRLPFPAAIESIMLTQV